MKICKDCKKELDESQFYTVSNKTKKLRSVCKECYKARYGKRQAEQQRERRKTEEGKKYFRDVSNRYYKTHQEKCKARTNAYSAAKRATPKGRAKMNAYSLKYRMKRYHTDEDYRARWLLAKHSRRAKMCSANASAEEYAESLSFFDNACAYCGSTVELTQEHIVPIVKGGTNTIDNIIPACRHCNCSKNAKDMLVWYKQQPFFSEERLNKIIAWSEICNE